jgi:hypothetical protein
MMDFPQDDEYENEIESRVDTMFEYQTAAEIAQILSDLDVNQFSLLIDALSLDYTRPDLGDTALHYLITRFLEESYRKQAIIDIEQDIIEAKL